ncbi:hypothetical protein EGW08_008561 [Elysia chlorotica]|uniref:Uncharacterized protein n=1 Tax=Elysia chlorotica TaxID=188477 RepID=A0A433TQ08_ELYCH|nr:hypothetical protein EGW08_008561 [Elysia chlorotica]
MVSNMDSSESIEFQWEFDQNAKEKYKKVVNNFKTTKSLSDGKSLPVKNTPIAYIGTSFSPSFRDQRVKLMMSNRKKPTVSLKTGDAATDSSSHKPYASSSLWKPKNIGPGPARKTFLTLTPVSRSSWHEGQGLSQARSPGVPLISLTPPLRAVDNSQISQITAASVLDAKRDGSGDGIVNPNSITSYTTPQSSPHQDTCIFCRAEASRKRLQEELDPSSHSSIGQENEDTQSNSKSLDQHDDVFLSTDNSYRHPACIDTDHSVRFERNDEFSKFSKLPGIKLWEHNGYKTDSDTTHSHNSTSTSSEVDNLVHQMSYGGAQFTHNLWENPKLSRKDTLLDSISDRNLLDQKTLFSKKVDASYSRITHENTVILPPVECNRRHRDVLGDSSYLLEKKYVNEAFAKHPKEFHSRKIGGNVSDGPTTIRKALDLHGTGKAGKDPGMNSKRKFGSKYPKPTVNRTNRDSHEGMCVSERNHHTFENEQYIVGNQYFPHYRLSLGDVSDIHDSGLYPSQTDGSMFRLGRSQQPGKILSSNGLTHSNGQSTMFSDVNPLHHDRDALSYNRGYGGQIFDIEPERDNDYNYPHRQARLRLPTNGTDTNHRRESYPMYTTGKETRLLPLASQNSQFETPSHETTHFCDVLGKNSCSRCREQKARRSKGHESVSSHESVSINKAEMDSALAGLGRTGIVSPPPTPSPSPTFFLPVKALHKVIIKVKDKQNMTSVTSVGVNEDVVRRTTALNSD